MTDRIKLRLHRVFRDDAYTRNRSAALKRNKVILRVMLMGATACLLLLFCASFLSANYARMRPAYGMMVALYSLLLVLSYWAKDTVICVLGYALHFMFVAFCSYTSAFIWSTDVCVMILSELFLFPTLFLDKNWRVTGTTVLCSLLYLIIIFPNKEPSVFSDEVINVTCFALMGSIIGTFTRSATLKYFSNLESLRLSQEHYRLALKHSGGAICEYDIAQKCLLMTPEVAAIFDASEKVYGVPYALVRKGLISEETVGAFIAFFDGITCGEKTGTAAFECKTASGWRWHRASYSTIYSSDGQPVSAVISFSDITDQRAKDEALKLRAELDGLTGIYNRATTEMLIQKKLAERKGAPCALLLADLDDLKTINDTLGHPQGDRALRLFADVLRLRFRQTDIVGRVGGDEFVVFLTDTGSRAEMEPVLNQLLQKIAMLHVGEKDEYALSASIGVTLARTGEQTFDEMYQSADQALYQAKRGGKKQYAFFTKNQ